MALWLELRTLQDRRSSRIQVESIAGILEGLGAVVGHLLVEVGLVLQDSVDELVRH